MVGTGRVRDAGGTPDRAAAVRPRQEAKAPELVDSDPDETMVVRDDAADSSRAFHSDSDDESEDKVWHVKKKMPYVDVGHVFKIENTEGQFEFKRTGSREAICTTCGLIFHKYSYHLQGLMLHGAKCAAKRRKLDSDAAAKSDWSGNLSHTHSFGDADTVTVLFEKMVAPGDFTRVVKCNECGDEIKIWSDRHLDQHVVAKHKPESVQERERLEKAAAKRAEERKAAAEGLGDRGRAAFSTFYEAAKQEGERKKKVCLQTPSPTLPSSRALETRQATIQI